MTPEEAIVTTADRIAVLLEAGADPRTPLPGAEWTVGEAAAHLALAGKLMADIGAGEDRPYGDGTPSGLAAANRAALAVFPQRDPAVLGAEIADRARDFVAAAAGCSPREAVLTPMGPMDRATLGSYLLTHLLGHGYDIAVALRGPHMVDRHMVAFTLPFMRLAMPRVVNSGAIGRPPCVLSVADRPRPLRRHLRGRRADGHRYSAQAPRLHDSHRPRRLLPPRSGPLDRPHRHGPRQGRRLGPQTVAGPALPDALHSAIESEQITTERPIRGLMGVRKTAPCSARSAVCWPCRW
ncbi:maleylpyruvate isomerase family mycothiol-dependent enzyme [Streptomyces sp. NPDC058295]|uniref:maleylpyruvate isomerase family mycothiol-dependent enzyme n=1 Tax=Streptomyces sp. NPDC058295 TaxID=3346431 RepID=UPI0036EA3678